MRLKVLKTTPPDVSSAETSGGVASVPSKVDAEAAKAPGTLSIVSTPIGCPEDITLRALRLLREAALIVAEEARVTRNLLLPLGIDTEIVSCRPRAERDVVAQALSLLRAGKNVALVCDAGTPLLADPGLPLVLEAMRVGIPVTAAPGPVAAVAALVLSGFPAGRFAFDGFPPRTRTDRQAFFAALAQESRTLVLYESRAHLRATLHDLAAALDPSRRIAVVRDATRPTEHIFRGTLQEAFAFLCPTPPRGEYTLVIAAKDSYKTLK